MWVIDVYHGGLGQHGFDFANTGDPTKKLQIFGKIQVAMQPVWAAALTLTRLSILNLYTHIFSVHNRFKIGCWFIMTWAVLWFLGDLIATFMVCRPIAFNWDPTISSGKCGNARAAYISIHTSNIIIDFSIASLPAPILWGLQMKTWKKIGIICMFALGAFICAISIARLVLFDQVDLTDPEFTYLSGTLYLFTAMEPLLAISLACMPLLRPTMEYVANSAAISWVKYVTSSLGYSKSSSGLSSGKRGATSSISELPLHLGNNNYCQMGEDKGIGVGVEFNQDYEMDSLVTRQIESQRPR